MGPIMFQRRGRVSTGRLTAAAVRPSAVSGGRRPGLLLARTRAPSDTGPPVVFCACSRRLARLCSALASSACNGF
jgi:hypothetical protein